MPNSEMLCVVDDMARRLLTEEEVDAVMRTCRRVKVNVRISAHHISPAGGRMMFCCRSLQYIAERSVENLIRHLLAVLDRPEKLLLLREVR